ncbi:MAG: helicase, partial [Gammaproteobacteria bacterium]|nr:helicase [Gammaproteobacteria bacterium]
EFSALVKLWRAYRRAREGPRRELRRWCKERGLSVLRLSEWEDVYSQVVDRAAEIGIVPQRKAASYTGIHRALLAGFCTMVGTRGEDGTYVGTRGVHFHIFPGSPLRRRRARWVMAANIVETSRVFARRVAEIEPMWVESAAHHLLKREFLEPDWDEAREEVVARERIGFLGLLLSANRLVNYGPIAPEESRLIFAREALVYQRLRRRPDWLLENDRALLEAQRMEDRLRTRDLVRAPDYFVEFYDRALPRQVSSAATLEYFTRHLSDEARRALTLRPEDIFARSPDPHLLAQFPERVALPALAAPPDGAPDVAQPAPGKRPVSVPVDYRFAPGDPRDGATLQIPLLVLPTLSRAQVDAAVPGLAAPRVEALLRSLPKDARRGLIPIGATALHFMNFMGGPSTNVERLGQWLKEFRGIPASLIRFDFGAVPAHLSPQLAIVDEGKELVEGSDVAVLRRRCAATARAALDRCARDAYPLPWRRFELDQLVETAAVDVGQGCVHVYPTLMLRAQTVEVGFEWTAPEAARRLEQGAAYLARLQLARQARDLAKKIAADTHLVLAASPYLAGNVLVEVLLQLIFRRACFQDAGAPRTRTAFDAAVDAGRERLYPAFDELAAAFRAWLDEARAIRSLLDDPRMRAHSTRAEESHAHLRRVFANGITSYLSDDWMRQLPRYLKAEERRWQRLLARGSEPPQTLHELQAWSVRAQSLEAQVSAEMRWIPQLDEFHAWIEEYRVSLYAQELRTLGPVSAARLTARAAEIEAWITR